MTFRRQLGDLFGRPTVRPIKSGTGTHRATHMSKKCLKFNCQNQIVQNKWARFATMTFSKRGMVHQNFFYVLWQVSFTKSINGREYRFKHSCSLAVAIGNCLQCGSHCSDLRNLILTFKLHTLLAHPCVALSYCIIRCHKNKKRWTLN